jgi:hypothetical protein
MKYGNRVIAHGLVLALGLCQPSIAATAEDEALFKACPGLEAWASAHPRHGDEISPVASTTGDTPTAPALRAALKQRAEADQRVRQAVFGHEGPPDPKAVQELTAVDRANLEWLKRLVDDNGFPTPEQVGEDGVADAFLLVQHADADPLLQQAVLESLGARLDTTGIRKSEFAMLTDRVLVAQGKPQRFGTQFKRAKDGSFAMLPTEEMDHLGERRQQMDLMPLPVYECVLRASYASS